MAYCTQCGHQADDADQFCSNCGARQGTAAGAESGSARYPPPPARPSPSGPGPDPLAGVTPRAAAIACYIPTVGWIAAVVVLASNRFKKDNVLRFHAFQGLYIFAAWLMVQWVIQPMSHTFGYTGVHLDHVLKVGLLFVWVFMIVKASRGEAYVLPIIGELAQRSAAEQ